ncbi:MAG: hypothetical protein V7661_17940, partial [Sulfitobacter sp.]
GDPRAAGDHYTISTDERSVIATAPWALLAHGRRLFSADDLAQSFHPNVTPASMASIFNRVNPFPQPKVPRWDPVELNALDGWEMNDQALIENDGSQMVACFEIAVNGREVDSWCQPFCCKRHKTTSSH